MIGQKLGSYEVVAKLGEGGMGAVYRARDTKLNRDVALKTILPTLVADAGRVARFRREAQVLASLNHPNIAAIYGIEDAGPTPVIVMELVDGPTLADLITGPLPLDDALAIARQILLALEAAHEHGVIHRDLKPANVKVKGAQGSVGAVKVLDFGLAKAVGDASAVDGATMTSPAMTAAGVILGTAAYMSPEQARGRVVDKRTDLWAFGCVLYEMLTGVRPFAGDNVTDVLAAVVRQEPDWTALPPNTPAAVRRVLDRCLQKDPNQRLRDAADARLDLDPSSFAADRAGEIRERSIVQAQPRASGRLLAVIALATLVALVAGAAAGVWWRAGRDVPPPDWTGVRLGGPAITLHPRISPDGNLLAFQALVNGLSQVAVMKPGAGSWSVLTSDRSKGAVNVIDWSPDGSRIYFDRFTDVPNGIYSVPALGGDERLLVENAGSPVALKDGSLAILRRNAERQPRLYRLWPGTGRVEPLPGFIPTITAEQALVRELPGGRLAFFGRPASDAAGSYGLYVLALDSGVIQPFAPGGPLPEPFSMAIDPNDGSVLAAVREASTYRVLRFSQKRAAPQSLITFLSQPLFDVDSTGALYVSLMDRTIEVLRLRDSGRPEPLATMPGMMSATAPLPDGRVLGTARVGAATRAVIMASGKEPVVFAQTDEDTYSPFAPIDARRVALLIGPRASPQVAIVSTDNGRILGRVKVPPDITSLGASPDGKTLYFSVSGRISAMPLSGGEPRAIGAGESFTVDPDTGDLIVKLHELERFRLARLPAGGGQPTPIEIKGDLRLILEPLAAGAVRHGRLVLPVATADSWFWFVGQLDLATGRLERVPMDYFTDVHWVSWSGDGHIIATGITTSSGLWKFSRVPAR